MEDVLCALGRPAVDGHLFAVPLLIGFILMPLLEENLRTVLLLASTYDEGILFVLKRPAFLTMTALFISIAIFIGWRRRKYRRTEQPTPGS